MFEKLRTYIAYPSAGSFPTFFVGPTVGADAEASIVVLAGTACIFGKRAAAMRVVRRSITGQVASTIFRTR